MAQMTEVDYIILASSAGADSPRPVAVVVRDNSGSVEELGFYLLKLPRAAPGSEISYLNQLFSSWKGLPTTDHNALFAELSELSSEPLFAEVVGSCSMKQVSKIVSEALGQLQEYEDLRIRISGDGIVT